MKKMSRICSSDESQSLEDTLDDKISDLKEDFDYLISGLETLGRRDAGSIRSAISTLNSLGASIQDYISDVAEMITD